jgi:hypothetical protein
MPFDKWPLCTSARNFRRELTSGDYGAGQCAIEGQMIGRRAKLNDEELYWVRLPTWILLSSSLFVIDERQAGIECSLQVKRVMIGLHTHL